MQNILINMCEKFHYDRLRNNDRALGKRKSDNKKPRTTTRTRTTFVVIGDPFPGPKKSGQGFARAAYADRRG